MCFTTGKAKVLVQTGSLFTIEYGNKLTLQNVEFDFVESMTTNEITYSSTL